MAASRFRDQVAAREQVSGSIPLRPAGQKGCRDPSGSEASVPDLAGGTARSSAVSLTDVSLTGRK